MAANGDSVDVRKMILHILSAKIQKQRLKDMTVAAEKRKFKITSIFSPDVTHVVTECKTLEQVVKCLKLASLDDLQNVSVLSVEWFTACMKAGHPVPIEDKHRIKPEEAHQPRVGHSVNGPSEQFTMAEYACQRATYLKHHNEKFTEALELLQKYAELRDTDSDYSRALAFRRASCVLKCLPCPLRNMQQLRNLTHVGDHSRRVIREILEDGECQEVEQIRSDPWFHKMKLFSGVFGIGPSTAKKWIEKGWTSIEEARQNCSSADWRVQWGLAFHYDLITPVSGEEAQYIRGVVSEEAESLCPGVILELTGGFRRGKQAGHDVDILITNPHLGREAGLLARLLKKLDKRGFILCGNLEKSTFNEDVLQRDFKLSARGQLDHFEKWLGIVKVPETIVQTHSKAGNEDIRLPASFKESIDDYEPQAKKQRAGNEDLSPLEMAKSEKNWVARRVDLIVSPYDQYFYALVGWTGNKQFNRDLRWYAPRELNMKLTSHGLYDLAKGCTIPANSEREVFENLKIPYREPWERNC